MVTGGLGTVGSGLVSELQRRGCHVVSCDLVHQPDEVGFSLSSDIAEPRYARADVGEFRQIERVFEQCQTHGAAALAEPVKDTIKRAGADLLVTGSVDRHQLYAMQTPQIFERGLIEDAYRAVYAGNVSVTDEVSAVERLGSKVVLVLNEDFNFKITYPRDLALAEFVLKQRAQPLSQIDKASGD